MAGRSISPVEPAKHHPLVAPNAHPYAIKTTSSALLSRNSSPHHANHTRHHYVPTSSSLVARTGVRRPHSSSLSAVEGMVDGARITPAPLPTPPPTVAAQSDNPLELSTNVDELRLMCQVQRTETMPGSATKPLAKRHSCDQRREYKHDQDSRQDPYAGLPLNPNRWSTDELTTYLESSLGLANHTTPGSDDGTGLVGILAHARTRGLTGRELLQLSDGDLANTPLSGIQRSQLLDRSRALRTHVLCGHVYANVYHAHKIPDGSTNVYSPSAHSSTLFRSIRGPSASTGDLRLFPDSHSSEGADAFPLAPAMTLHRSNSVSDATAQRYKDLARMHMRRRGRVRGLVETWERASTSGSEYSTSEEGSVSGSESESEYEADPELGRPILDNNSSQESSSDLPSSREDVFSRDVRSPKVDSVDPPREPASLTPPPPYTTHEVLGDEEEPSIEELLASSSNMPLSGARAWEIDFGLGETMKRIPTLGSTEAEGSSPNATLVPGDDDQQTRDDYVRLKRPVVRGRTGSRGKNPKTQHRVVTAIFTGSSEDIPKNVGDGAHLAEHHRDAGDVVCGEVPANSEGTLRALEESIATTRVQMETFRVRLEQIEADTARLEAELDRAQYPHVPYSSGAELPQRRSEASVQATIEKVDLPRDEAPVARTREGGVLRGWEQASLCNVTHAIVTRTLGWLSPSGLLGKPTRDDRDQFPASASPVPGVNRECPSMEKRGGHLTLARMSCSIILVSFAICTAVLRRFGIGRWARRP